MGLQAAGAEPKVVHGEGLEVRKRRGGLHAALAPRRTQQVHLWAQQLAEETRQTYGACTHELNAMPHARLLEILVGRDDGGAQARL